MDEQNKIRSLFEDDPPSPDIRAPSDRPNKRKIVRQGAKAQLRTVIIVLAVVLTAVIAILVSGSKPSQSTQIKNFTTGQASLSHWKDQLELSATVENSDTSAVTAPERAIIQKLLVEEGNWVTQGQPLVNMTASDLEASYATLSRELGAKERAVEKLKRDAEFKTRSYESSKAQAIREQESAQSNLTLTEKLFGLGSASKDELEAARSKLLTANEKIESIELDFEQSKSQNEFSLQDALANLTTAKEELSDLAQRIASLRIKSPIEGRVIEIADGAREAGKLMSQYASILNIADTRKPLAKAKLPESYVGRVKLGQELNLTTNSGTIVAVVSRIGVIVRTDDSTYGTYVDLYVQPKSRGVELSTGSSVSLSLSLGERDNVLTLARGPWFVGTTQAFVYLVSKDGKSAQKTKVSFGSVNNDSVEVLTGLHEGDQIITSSYQNIVSYETIELNK